MKRNNAYYLDTNIIIYYLFSRNNLDSNVFDILSDCSNFFYASYVAVKEVVHLQKQDRINLSKEQKDKTMQTLLNEAGIISVPVTKKHLSLYETLDYVQNHNDPNDLLIIAQSVSDRIPLISSDHAFKNYQKQGLQLVFNKR